MTKTNINTQVIKESISSINVKINRINQIFENVDKEIDVIRTNNYWVGSTSNTVFQKYSELSNCYETVINSLNKLNSFLLNIANSYEAFDNITSSDVEESDLDM